MYPVHPCTGSVQVRLYLRYVRAVPRVGFLALRPTGAGTRLRGGLDGGVGRGPAGAAARVASGPAPLNTTTTCRAPPETDWNRSVCAGCTYELTLLRPTHGTEGVRKLNGGGRTAGADCGDQLCSNPVSTVAPLVCEATATASRLDVVVGTVGVQQSPTVEISCAATLSAQSRH